MNRTVGGVGGRRGDIPAPPTRFMVFSRSVCAPLRPFRGELDRRENERAAPGDDVDGGIEAVSTEALLFVRPFRPSARLGRRPPTFPTFSTPRGLSTLSKRPTGMPLFEAPPSCRRLGGEGFDTFRRSQPSQTFGILSVRPQSGSRADASPHRASRRTACRTT